MAQFDYYHYWNPSHYLTYVGNSEDLDVLFKGYPKGTIERAGGFATIIIRDLKPNFFRRIIGLGVSQETKQREYKEAFYYAIEHFYESIS